MNMKVANAMYYSGILIAPEKIAMFQGKSEVASVQKKDIQTITLEEGYQSERPILQIAFGIVILLLPLYSILYLLGGLLSGATIRVPILLALAFAPLGIWMIREGIRRGYYLHITLENDTRKLGFDKNCDQTALKAFLKDASQLGYVIDASLLGLKN
jgi:hypothetical protein